MHTSKHYAILEISMILVWQFKQNIDFNKSIIQSKTDERKFDWNDILRMQLLWASQPRLIHQWLQQSN